jgi:L-rhamnose isomerase / sugar isomerase
MNNNLNNPSPAWMIDASHNIKDPLEDLIQSLEAIMLAYAQALILDQNKLEVARENSDVVLGQELLQDAFRTDLRPLIAEVRKRKGAALNPITTYRHLKIREQLMSQRGTNTIATGL